jgi:glycerol-3-phosphate acyltransferase PlsY
VVLLAVEAVLLVPAYLIGAIPFALIVARVFFHCDLRQRGSGNLGATNTFRELGAAAGVGVLALDMAKGAAGVAVAAYGVRFLAPGGATADISAFQLLAMFAVIAGHIYSPYLGFRGGKGIAAAAGALLFVMPLVAILLLVGFAALVAVSRMVSLGSVVGAAAFPFLSWAFYSHDLPAVALGVIAAALVIWRHRGNVSRIIKGTEPRLSFRKREVSGE